MGGDDKCFEQLSAAHPTSPNPDYKHVGSFHASEPNIMVKISGLNLDSVNRFDNCRGNLFF